MINSIPRLAAIHDLSGFGRSSLTVVIPIVSSFRIQVCPIPTALLSTHTSDFVGYHFRDLTEDMNAISRHWKQLSLVFNGIYSGFLGSCRQLEVVADFIDYFRGGDPDGERALIVVDPVLGDEGSLYPTMERAMVDGMVDLIGRADVITPNLTEAALLLREQFQPTLSRELAKRWCHSLSELGPGHTIITGIPMDEESPSLGVVGYSRERNCYWLVKTPTVPGYYPGTGDIFGSVLTGALLSGRDLPEAMSWATLYISKTMANGIRFGQPNREGLPLESTLDMLKTSPQGRLIYESI